METDIRRKISSVEELCDQAKSNLQDFCSQKKQLQDFLSQMSEWLKNVERSLVDSPCGTAPEEICRVKVGESVFFCILKETYLHLCIQQMFLSKVT